MISSARGTCTHKVRLWPSDASANVAANTTIDTTVGHTVRRAVHQCTAAATASSPVTTWATTAPVSWGPSAESPETITLDAEYRYHRIDNTARIAATRTPPTTAVDGVVAGLLSGSALIGLRTQFSATASGCAGDRLRKSRPWPVRRSEHPASARWRRTAGSRSEPIPAPAVARADPPLQGVAQLDVKSHGPGRVGCSLVVRPDDDPVGTGQKAALTV